MDLRQLKYFVCIVESGSVSRASKELHIAQPALSGQVARLEAELGVRLLTRTVRGVTPTESGAAVFAHAKAVLKQVAETQSIAVQAESGISGLVTLGLPWTVASLIGLNLLRRVRAELPAVRLVITEGPSAVLSAFLAQGKLDLAVLCDGNNSNGLKLMPIVEEPLLLVGASGTLDRAEPWTLENCAALPFIMLSRPNGIRESIEEAWLKRQLAPRVVAEINGASLLMNAIRAGIGFSILPSCAMEESLQREDIDACELEGDALTRTVFLGVPRTFPLGRAAEVVYGFVHELSIQAVQSRKWRARTIKT